MAVDNILASLNKTLDQAIALKDTDNNKKRLEISHKLLQGIDKLQLLIESGAIEQQHQLALDEVRAIAHMIKPTDILDFYR